MNEKPKFGCKTILIGFVIIVAIMVLTPMLFNNGDNNVDTRDTDDDVSAQTVDDGIFLGSPVITEQLDRDGCAVNSLSNLNDTNSFYVVAPSSSVPSGTEIFVRLYHNDIAVEDLPAITANQDYSNTCLAFMFETINGRDFESGDYEAEFLVNGNPYNAVQFEIR